MVLASTTPRELIYPLRVPPSSTARAPWFPTVLYARASTTASPFGRSPSSTTVWSSHLISNHPSLPTAHARPDPVASYHWVVSRLHPASLTRVLRPEVTLCDPSARKSCTSSRFGSSSPFGCPVLAGVYGTAVAFGVEGNLAVVLVAVRTFRLGRGYIPSSN